MFKFICGTAVLLAFAHVGYAKDECTDPSTNKTINAGEVFSVPDSCYQLTCYPDGTLSAITCASVAVTDVRTCPIKAQDNSKPYPECCASFSCPDATETHAGGNTHFLGNAGLLDQGLFGNTGFQRSNLNLGPDAAAFLGGNTGLLNHPAFGGNAGFTNGGFGNGGFANGGFGNGGFVNGGFGNPGFGNADFIGNQGQIINPGLVGNPGLLGNADIVGNPGIVGNPNLVGSFGPGVFGDAALLGNGLLSNGTITTNLNSTVVAVGTTTTPKPE